MQKKTKIVIADDNADIRQTLKDIFSEKGYAVETVDNGYELLGYLKAKSADIIILDLMMPQKNGVEIISAIKGLCPYARIIIYTGFQKYKNSTCARLADRFLLKGEDPEKLLQTVEELR